MPAKRGRPRKPTALKVHDGDFIKDPQRQNHNEPEPEKGIPQAPPQLSEIAAEEWYRVSKELDSMSVLAQVDRGSLEQYCQAYGEWREAHKTLMEEGRYLWTDKGGRTEHPAGKSFRALAGVCHKFLCEFGLTPASRSRIVVDKPDKMDDAEKRFFA